MARSLIPSQQKLAEKLTLLNDRGVGMLTRIYNIKKACGDAKSKPGFLSDKSLESSIKYIVRRFPNIDTKGLQAITQIRSEIIKSLSLYYYTFVDLLDFKDSVCELLTTMDACQVHLDITLNFELTKAYLDLVAAYVSLMILLSKVEDRKAVLGLFNAAHELVHNQSDLSFPRLGQMIMDYDPPLKKLSEEFVPHAKLLYSALISLWPVYISHNISADKWRSDQKLSLVGNPGQLLKPSQTETISCEYLALESMERWIIFGFMLYHQALQQEQPNKLWLSALENSWVVALFRDEVIYIHAYIQGFFDTIKGYGKRISEIKDTYNQAIQKATYRHRERRKFLRTALKELGLILTDQPGLLGPKSLLIFIALCFARDEVYWLLRHNDNPPQQKSKGKSAEDLVDRQLPELLFHMEELRVLVRKYSQVIQRYYVQYLSGFDAIALNQMMQNLSVCPEDESIILSSLCNNIANLSVKQVEENELFDFRALRLDWLRLQAYASVSKAPLFLPENRDLACLLDAVLFHTKMVDYLDEMMVETSDLSIFWKLKSELEAVRRKGAAKGGGSARACARCRAELGLIINRGAFCRWCRQRVCKNCREYVTNDASDWICTVCHKQMELTAASGDWMNQFVRRPSKRRDNRIAAVETVKRSLQRSWTFSDASPSPWAALRNSPEMRAYSSMPRHQDCEFIARTAFTNRLNLAKASNTETSEQSNEQHCDIDQPQEEDKTDNDSTVVEENAASDSERSEENPVSVPVTDNESSIGSPFTGKRSLSESTSIDQSSIGSPVNENRFCHDSPAVSPLTEKRNSDTVLEPITGAVFRKVTLKKRRVDTRRLPPGVTPPRSRRSLPRAQEEPLLKDREDYRLVFISSSDSSSREELQSDDGSSTCSGLVAAGECDWDYFEPGGGGGGEAAQSVSSAPPCVSVPVPFLVPIPVPVPVPVLVPWTPDLTIRVQHLWSMQQLVTVTLNDGQMSQDLLKHLQELAHLQGVKSAAATAAAEPPDNRYIQDTGTDKVQDSESDSVVVDVSSLNSVDNTGKPVGNNIVDKNSDINETDGVVLKTYKPLEEKIVENRKADGLLKENEECLMDLESESSSSSSDESERVDKSSRRFYKFRQEESEESSGEEQDEESSGEFSMASSLSSSPGSGKFKRVFVVNDSDSDLGELPEYNDDSAQEEGEVTLLRHVTMEEVRLSSILQGVNVDLRTVLGEPKIQDSLECAVSGERELPESDHEVVSLPLSSDKTDDKVDKISIIEDSLDSLQNTYSHENSCKSKTETGEFLSREIEYCDKMIRVSGNDFILAKSGPGEGSDEECGKLCGSNTSDEFSGTESMELEQGQIRAGGGPVTAGESWRETGRYTSLVMITQEPTLERYTLTLDTAAFPPQDSEVNVVTGNGTTAVVNLEEGLPDDDSWVEELDREDLVTTTDSSEDDASYVDREEELRGYNPRSAIDFTLHTIVEESCEESEIETEKNRPTELEKYFFYGVGDGMNDCRETDTMSETSSIHSEGLESLGGYEDGDNDKDPAELASSRLEKYFLSGLLGCSRRDSDGSVGSDSEGKPSPEQRRKRLVRARGTGRQHSSSQDNLHESEPQEEAPLESEGSSTETDSNNELSNSFEKSDGQFDTVKRTKKKKRSVVSAPSLELLEVAEDHPGSGSREDLDSDDGNKSPQPDFLMTSDLGSSRNKQQSRDSGFMGSCDDLLKESKEVPSGEVSCVPEEEVEHVPEVKQIEEAVIPQVKISPPTGLIRKDSFNNWSSDEETNLMMSKMRQFFKTMVASQPKASSPNVVRSKPPQLVHFESELTRLMKTVPGIRDEQVREIVEYLSSEDTWSDSYDSSDYTSSDLEGGSKKSALQEEISASCRQIISNFEAGEESADGINKDTAFVYQRLVASFSKLDAPSSDSSASHNNSPPLIAKVMQHIGSRLVALMHEVSSAEGGSPKTSRYHRRLQPKLSTTSTTEDEEDSIEDYSPLPRSKSHDPLIEENRQEASDNERFSWRGSFESALMASDSRQRLASGGEGSVSASALALAAKRRSAGDLLFKTSSREQLDRVRSCGSIGGSVEDKIWGLRHQKRRRSSVPDSGGSNDGDDDSEEECGRSTTLPRSLQSSCAATNSLPRLPTTPTSASPSIYKAHSVHQVSASKSVVSARYRPPGYNSRSAVAPPRRDARRRAAQTPSPSNLSSPPSVVSDDASVCSESVSVRSPEEDDRLATNRASSSSLGARSDSLASVYSGAGEGRYGSVAVRGEVEFGLQYNYKQGALEIYVKQCKDLAAVDIKRNRSDPYVKVYLLPDKSKSGKRKTRVKKHTLNPIFEETLKFHITLEGLESRTLWLSVWHSDMFGRNDFLGEVTMALENKVFDDPLPKIYTLQERTEPLEELLSSRGELIVGLKFVPPSADSSHKKNQHKGCLQVLVKEAKNLSAVKSNGTSDPFCKSYLLPDKGRSSKQKTPVLRKCCSPAWNYTFAYQGVTLEELSARSLELTIWDHDRLASNEFLGGVRLNLGTGKHTGKAVDWMDASGKETSLWQRMLERPNLWVESCLPLRPSLDVRSTS